MLKFVVRLHVAVAKAAAGVILDTVFGEEDGAVYVSRCQPAPL